jgi:hypothetical protein
MIVGLGIGPFPQGGLHEAFGLSIGSWHIGPGALVLDFQHSQRLGVAVRAKADAIVGHLRCGSISGFGPWDRPRIYGQLAERNIYKVLSVFT